MAGHAHFLFFFFEIVEVSLPIGSPVVLWTLLRNSVLGRTCAVFATKHMAVQASHVMYIYIYIYMFWAVDRGGVVTTLRGTTRERRIREQAVAPSANLLVFLFFNAFGNEEWTG